MYKTTAFLFAVLSLSLTTFAGTEKRDGNWWRAKSDLARLSYVTGLFDGLRLAHDAMVDSNQNEQADAFNQSIHAVIGKRTNDQIKDGLDVFYADFRNRHIDAHRAFWIVLASSSGVPAERLQSMIDRARNEEQ